MRTPALLIVLFIVTVLVAVASACGGGDEDGAATATPGPSTRQCMAGWAGYTDAEGRFSICYPDTFTAETTDSSLYATTPGTPDADEKSTILTVSWGERPYFSLEPNDDNCAQVADPLLGPTGSRTVTLDVSRRAVKACLNDGRVNSIQGSTPLADDGSDTYGFVRFTLNYSGQGDDAYDDALAILETLEIEYR